MAGLGLYLVFGLLDLTVGGRLTSYLLLIRFGAVCPTLLAVFGLSFLRISSASAKPACPSPCWPRALAWW